MSIKLLLAAVSIVNITLPYVAQGQTEKTLQQYMGGQTVETPYITHSEFENISIDGRGRMGDLLTVHSIDQAVRILGKPTETEVTEINSGGYKKSTELLYNGFRISKRQRVAFN
jgi:hypothetical protein